MENLTLLQQIFAFLGTFITGIGTFWTWVKFRKTNEKKNLLEQLNTMLDEVSKMSEQMLEDRLKLSKSKTMEIQYKTAIERIKNACNECSEKVDVVLTQLNLKQ